MPRHEDVRRRLDHEVHAYVYEVLREIFDFDRLCGRLRVFRKLWGDNLADIYPDEYQRLLSEVAKVEDCRGVGAGFRNQLTRIENTASDDKAYLKERLAKASAYFLPVFADMRMFLLKTADLEIDNKEVRKGYREDVDELIVEVEVVCASLEAVAREDFTPEMYGKISTSCLLKDREECPV